MVASLLSFLISRRFQPTPVYHALLQQDHVHLPSPATRIAPASWTAGDVMGSELGMVPPDASVQKPLGYLTRQQRAGVLDRHAGPTVASVLQAARIQTETAAASAIWTLPVVVAIGVKASVEPKEGPTT